MRDKMWHIFVFGVLLIFTFKVDCFNIEDRQYILKSIEDKGSYFGFSVAMHKVEEEGKLGEKWLLVGAPLGKNLQPETNRSGALYKCPINEGFERNCEQVITDGLRVDDFGEENATLFPPGKDEIKEDQWMGVAVKSQGPGGKVVVCAHRYIHSENIEHHHNGFGLCYLMTNELKLEEDLQPCKGKPVERMHQQFGVCQAGTSLDVLDNGIALMGAPGPYTWRGTIFSKTVVGDFIEKDANTYMGPLNETTEPIDKYSYLGMSVTGGRFINDEWLYAAGAPRSNLTGQVYFFRQLKENTQLNIIKIVNGFDFASSFGYEILAEDVNNDGHDDLIVAAPFYYDEKHGGQIYVYLNLSQCLSNPHTECQYSQKIMGKRFSRFGFALTSVGDINKDGYNDIAVGAPYESWGKNGTQTGAVYIFLGSKDGLVTQESQVIRERKVLTFGYSLSGGLDMDDNGYPDLLVGAYESDVALLLRTRQIIDIDITIKGGEMKNIDASKKGCRTDPNSNHTCFSFQSCLNFKGDMKTRTFNVTYKLEERTNVPKSQRKRVFWKTRDIKDYKKETIITVNDISHPYCLEETVYIEPHVRDFLLPMQFVLNCSLTDTSPHSHILNKTSVKSFSATFQKDCGTDDICTSSLELEAEPLGVTPRDTKLNNIPVYIVNDLARDELHLKVNVKNEGEPGYEAKLFVEHPEELSYIALKPGSSHIQCTSRNKTLVSCDLGNPMGQKQREKAVLRFEIYRKTKPELLVKVYVNTTSTDIAKKKRKEFYVVLEKRAKFSLSSKRTTNLYFGGDRIRGESEMRSLEDIGPRVTHLFTLENTGKWALTNFNVTIMWPYQVYTGSAAPGKWLLYLEDRPRVTGPTRDGFCTVSDLSKINPLNIAGGPDLDEPENLIDAKSRTRRSVHERRKRDIDAIIEPKTKTVQDKTYKVVEFDCFSNTAKCVQIQCINLELPADGNLNIHVKSRLWNSTLTEDYNKVDWISIASFANVTVSSEFILDNQTMIFSTSETIVYAVPPQSMNYWWIIAAVICGLVVLIIIIFILYKCGFFKRNRVAKDKTLTGNLIPKEESKELLHH